jgi:hypothetical protein
LGWTSAERFATFLNLLPTYACSGIVASRVTRQRESSFRANGFICTAGGAAGCPAVRIPGPCGPGSRRKAHANCRF